MFTKILDKFVCKYFLQIQILLRVVIFNLGTAEIWFARSYGYMKLSLFFRVHCQDFTLLESSNVVKGIVDD